MTIADTEKYILIELPFQMIPSYAEEEIFNMAASGYTQLLLTRKEMQQLSATLTS